MLHTCRKYNLEVALVSSKTGAIKMLTLSDTSFITVCNNYFNPYIAKIKYDFKYKFCFPNSYYEVEKKHTHFPRSCK